LKDCDGGESRRFLRVEYRFSGAIEVAAGLMVLAAEVSCVAASAKAQRTKREASAYA
jgi:hypothetical protein